MNTAIDTVIGAVLLFAGLGVIAVCIRVLTSAWAHCRGSIVRTTAFYGAILLGVAGMFDLVGRIEHAALNAPDILPAGRVVQLHYPVDRPDLVVVETDLPVRIAVYGPVPFRVGQQLLMVHHRKDNTWWLMRKGGDESFRVYIQPRGPMR